MILLLSLNSVMQKYREFARFVQDLSCFLLLSVVFTFLFISFQPYFALFCKSVFLLGMFRLVRVERFHQSGFHRWVKVIAQEVLPVFQFHHSHHFFQRASVFSYQFNEPDDTCRMLVGYLSGACPAVSNS